MRGLPATWTPFVGRTRERAELIAALDASRLVTLLGPGGVGKTRLAAEVARELAPTLPLGATFVELVSTRPGFFLQTVASVLGVTERPGQALRDAVLARLRPGRSLLVLDNCEHLVDDTADFLTTLLGETTELLVLTTSRARIGVPGERVVPLSGLSLVAPSTGGAADSEAVALFFDRARMLDAQFDADPAAVGELCAQLDGMPLAIELATARSAALGITGLRAGLIDRLRLLSGGRSGDERHRSLRAVLDWSHELLDDEERTALRRLGRFAGEVDIAAATAVTGQPPAAVADLIGRLADESLLVHRQGGERWSLLETVRAYALDKLIEAGELDEVTDRYLRWAVDLSADLEDRLERGEPWRPAFDAVADDLRAALGLADGAVAAPLARSLGHLTYARRFLAESRRHYLRAAECAADDAQAARDLWSAAGVAQVESKGQLRYGYAVAAAERAAAAGDHGTQAAVLAEAVSVATRFPAIFDRDIGLAELQQMLDVAHRVAPPGDVAAAAQLTAADAWTETRIVDVPDPTPFHSRPRRRGARRRPGADQRGPGRYRLDAGDERALREDAGAGRAAAGAAAAAALAPSAGGLGDPRHPAHGGGERDHGGRGGVSPRSGCALRRRRARGGRTAHGGEQADGGAHAARPVRRGDPARRAGPGDLGGRRPAGGALAGPEHVLAGAVPLPAW